MVVILFFSLLWVLHPISIIHSLYTRFRKRIPVLYEDQNKFKNWKWIQKAGLRASGIFLFYIVFIVLINGWTFRWYIGGLILQVLFLLIIDRYLIAVNYSKKFWTDASSKIRNTVLVTKIVSYFYIATRLTFLLWWTLITAFMFVFPAGFTTDMYVMGIYGEMTGNRYAQEEHSPLGHTISLIDGADYSINTYFNGDIIIYNEEHSNNIYLFCSRYWIFMKYANTESILSASQDPAHLEFDAARKILYLDLPQNDPHAINNRDRIVYEDGNYYLDQYIKYVQPSKNYEYGDTASVSVLHKRIKL